MVVMAFGVDEHFLRPSCCRLFGGTALCGCLCLQLQGMAVLPRDGGGDVCIEVDKGD